MLKVFLPVILMFLVAACGSVATPVPDSDTLTLEAQDTGPTEQETDVDVVAEAATHTPLPPTATPVPPTVTPTPVPATPTPEADAIPAEWENIVLLVSRFSDPARGETLFQQTFEVGMQNDTIGEWACSTCHMVNTDDPGVGPGMLSLPERADNRIEGMPAEVYVVHSIQNPGEYIVDDYEDGVMPVGYTDILEEQDMYDLAAYLLSLGN
jgi:cytochrome c553